MKKILIISYMFLLVLGSLSLVNAPNVEGALAYTEDFDDDLIGGQPSEIWMTGESNNPNFEVQNTGISRSSPNIYQIEGASGEFAYWNYSLGGGAGSSTSIVQWRIYLWQTNNVNINWRVYFTDDDGNIACSIYLNKASGAFTYFPGSIPMGGAWELEWTSFTIRRLSPTVINVSFVDTLHGIQANDYGVSINWDDVTKIYMSGDSVADRLFLDDHTITVGSSSTEMEGYEYIGEYSMGLFTDFAERIIEEKYLIPVNINITGVDLVCDVAQYTANPDINDYWLRLTFGTDSPGLFGADDFFGIGGGAYIVRWDFRDEPLPTNDNPILMEWAYAGDYIKYNTYWSVAVSKTDLDKDGDILCKSSDQINMVYDGYEWAEDISYKIYYENLEIEDPPPHIFDAIVVNPDVLELHSDYAAISYFISTKDYTSYVTIYHTDILAEVGSEQGFPKLCDEWADTFTYVPFAIGNYKATLVRNSVNITYYNFTVTADLTPDYYIFNYPVVTTPSEEYTVSYRYFHGEGKDGAIFVMPNSYLTMPFNQIKEPIYLDANSSGNYTDSYWASRTFYYVLAIETSPGTYSAKKNSIHHVKLESMINIIDVKYKPVIIYDSGGTQIVNWYHSHLGQVVKIQDNNNLIADATFEQAGIVSYKITKEGMHLVEMYILAPNGTKYVIASITYGAVNADNVSVVDPDDPFGGAVPSEYKEFLGFGIVVIFLMFPVGISMSMGYSPSDIPLMIYLAMGSVGVGIAVTLGFLPMYWILLLLVSMVAGILFKLLGRYF